MWFKALLTSQSEMSKPKHTPIHPPPQKKTKKNPPKPTAKSHSFFPYTVDMFGAFLSPFLINSSETRAFIHFFPAWKN